ncbi:SDR family oxidoreductase [Nocardia sp. NPDC005366]|uniref:SDR family oxidoreductase n=1 Tax=Nocardia sp. NPDC005366 TaxID=3156878 RepID=UPI0033B7F2E2
MSYDLFALDGRVAVVTGGGRGIGKMIARGLLHAGATVYVSSRKAAELAATVEELTPLGRIEAIPADLSTGAGIDDLVNALGERVDTVHALFNNAGATWGAPLEEFPDSAWDKTFDLNVKSVFTLTRALLPMLRNAATPDNPARVINTGSIDGLRVPIAGFDNFSYSASKAAVHMLTRHLAAELAPEILVNAIAPGLFESKMSAAVLRTGGDAIAEQFPLKRIGRPDDIAGIAVFLASRASSYITGAIIPVDGGVSTTR